MQTHPLARVVGGKKSHTLRLDAGLVTVLAKPCVACTGMPPEVVHT
jgi:hypothetical protein